MLQQQLAEMGSPEGHLRQDALVTRLAVAVSAPWARLPIAPSTSGTPMEVDGGCQPAIDTAYEQQYGAAAARVDTVGEYAWQMVFHTSVTSSRVLDVKCARD